MKKLLCILCLLLTLMCVFAACDSETPNADGNTPNTEQGGGGNTQGPSGDNQGEQNGTHTHDFDAWSVSKSATCTEKGEEKRSCACGESETREIEKIAHAYGNWTVTKPATESEKGEEKRTCTGCTAFETREIPVTGSGTGTHTHAFGAWSESKAPTCAQKGEEKRSCTGCSAFETREISATGEHTYGNWGVATPATCGAKGEEKRTCTGCPAFETREILATGEHTYGNWSVATPATCGAVGEEKRTCTGCPAFETREILATGEHIYVQGKCACGAVERTVTDFYVREGNKIYFGSYPQSDVTDAALIAALNSAAGALPTSDNAQRWTSYGYYISGNVQDYMWYIDIAQGGEKYRGVYFTSYRPNYTTTTSAAHNTYQDDNGYFTGTVYWFKYEPIAWTVLKEERGAALLLCDMIIDSQAYQNRQSFYNGMTAFTDSNGAPDGTYANNYKYSTVRSWLNTDFLETAFEGLQRHVISVATVDNSLDSTGYESSKYVCENTQDKLFLLSAKESMTAEYGFTATASDTVTCQKKATAYALAQGVNTYSLADYAGNGHWWLRSPYDQYSYYARLVNYAGSTNYAYTNVLQTNYGVVPALWLCLDSTLAEHVCGEWQIASEPGCGTAGKEQRICSCGEIETREIPATGEHTYGAWGVVTPATCGAVGAEKRTCTACPAFETREIPATGAHIYGNWAVITPATCGVAGEEKHTCTGCTAFETRPIPATGHSRTVSCEATAATCRGVGNMSYWECLDCLGYFSDAACTQRIENKSSVVISATEAHAYNATGVCGVCGVSKGYTRGGDKIYFGSYPQTKVTSSDLIDTLNAKAGLRPTKENARHWTSYGYFNKGKADDYMWYIDLTHGGETYRGVYFTSYRPSSASDATSSSSGNQKNNGYTKDVVYWFKYEPIAWRVLLERDGVAFLLCDMIVDSREFDYEGQYDYSSNYAESTIRAWLNDTFLETAFTKLQQELILVTTVDNSAASTGYTSNPYACENTQDKIFLPSVVELTTADYGFWPSYSINDVARCKQATGYALAQGVAARMDSSYSTYGNAFWWLRSPLYRTSGYARYVNLDGVIGETAVYATSAGIVPALKLRLEESNQPLYEREGDTIYFGSYPQTRVTDNALITALNAEAGRLPTSTYHGAWTSYEYYTGTLKSNYMWYVDVSIGAERYRGVYTTAYRPYEIGKIATSTDYSYFDDNGYAVGQIYWFKYEPIAWTVLKETNGEALLLCNMILDSQQFDFDGKSSNNYAESTIRAWLNEVFYETAFTELRRQIILTTTVDNSAESTGASGNRYACEDTQDKVFLLSAKEATTAEYGFSTDNGAEDAARRKQTTDYAKSQGAYTALGGLYKGDGWWWLRSPASNSAGCACGVTTGIVNSAMETDYTCFGVVPAIWIRLN